MRWIPHFPTLSPARAPAIRSTPSPITRFCRRPFSDVAAAMVSAACATSPMQQASAASMQYATGVVSYAPGPYVEPPYNNASKALHAPNNSHTSLGNQGSLTVRFDTPIASDGNPDTGDILVYEGGGEPESVAVYVSEDGGAWTHLGNGRGQFDVDRFGPDRHFQFVRVEDLLPNTTGRPYAGADIDAIGFISAPEDECTAEGNPCNPLTGEKYAVEHDYESTGPGGLTFTRYYSTSGNRSTGGKIGRSWRHSYARSLYAHVSTNTWKAVIGADGRYQTFVPDGSGGWISPYSGEVGLAYANNRWTYTDADGTREIYDTTGKLLSIQHLNGAVQTLSYTLTTGQGGDGDPATLDRVTDAYGHSLQIAYGANGQISSVTTPLGTIGYRYDAGNNLEYVDRPDGSSRQYHYEDLNHPAHLTGITDERGVRYATWSYDADGRVASSEHAGGAERVTLAYNTDGTTTVTTGAGAMRVYQPITVKGVRRVGSITGDPCATCNNAEMKVRSYDDDGHLISHTDWVGITTHYGDYDAKGQYGYKIEAVDTPEQRRTDYTYDARFHNKITSITEPSVAPGQSKVTTYAYDDWGNRLSETVSGFRPDGTPVARTTTWQYNGPLHQLSQIDGPRSDVIDVTSYTYYPDDPGQGANRARLMRVTDATGTAVRDALQYSVTGKVLSESRPNGLTLGYTYYPGNDRLETLTESSDGVSRVTRWTYLPTGEVASITQGDGTPDATTLTFGYDDARRLTRITDGLGNSIDYVLDTEGNREAERIYDSTGYLRKQLTQTFDLYNRLAGTAQENETTDPDYALDGTLDTLTDGRGSVTDYSYDALKRLTHVVQADNGSDPSTANATTGYGYDAADRLTTVTDPVGGTTTYVYDDLGNLLAQTSPDTGTMTFTHDAAGNVLTKTDAKGQVFGYGYDALNRLVLQDAPGSIDDIGYAYDACPQGSGRLCRIEKANGLVDFGYDGFGNVTAHQDIGYTYDSAGRVRTLTYPSGAVVTYDYDAAGQISRVRLTRDGTTQDLAANIDRAPFGPVTALLYGNGLGLQQNVDTAYRLQSQTVAGILQLDYPVYDANGNLAQRQDGVTSAIDNFGYDALDRLDTASGGFGAREYLYDQNGNRTQLTRDGSITTYGYTANSNRLAQMTGAYVQLDANGNTLFQGNRYHVYTPTNRLQDAYVNWQLKGRYIYNGLGQRQSKEVGNQRTVFRYGLDGALLAETSNGGTVFKEYIYLDGQPLAVLTTTLPGASGPGLALTTTPAQRGGMLGFAWSGIGTPTPYDWVGIYAVGAPDTQYLDWAYTNGANAGSLSLGLDHPSLVPGQLYELRLYANDGYTRLATSAAFTLDPSGPTVIAASTPAERGGSIQVAWSGIANPTASDWIGVYVPGSSDQNYLDWIYTGGAAAGSGTLNLSHPALNAGGTYELRLFANDGYTRLATGGTFVLQGQSGVASSKLHYIHNDHLGTPKALTDESGTAVWRATHDPFGQATVDADPDGDGVAVEFNVRFPGQYYDGETVLHYNYFRTYDPSTGRYLESDPIGLEGALNTYNYADANPILFLDYFGLKKVRGRGGDPRLRGNSQARFGVFGCVGACASYTQGDRETQISFSSTLGGGLQICTPPKNPPTPCDSNNVPKPSCGTYDPNCDNKTEHSISITRRGFGFGYGKNPDGSECLIFGPFASWPIISPTIHVGGASE